MRFSRQLTISTRPAYAGVEVRRHTIRPFGPDGVVGGADVLVLAEIEVPAHWPADACEAFHRHALRRGGVPRRVRPVPEDDVPDWLWRHEPDEHAMARFAPEHRWGAEQSVFQVFDRLAGAWTYWGWKGGYFDREEDARAFFDELRALMCRRQAFPDISQLAATGLDWAYGVAEPGTAAGGSCAVDFQTGRLRPGDSRNFAPSGAVINGVGDGLHQPGGMMALWSRESALLAAGLATGVDVSLPATGPAALMAQLGIGAATARAVAAEDPQWRSGRRVVTIDAEHPAAATFAGWKNDDDHKVAALACGSAIMRRHLRAVHEAVTQARVRPAGTRGPSASLRLALMAAREATIPERLIERVALRAAQGLDFAEDAIFDADWDGEAYATVGGQHATHLVRLGNERLDRMLGDEERADELWRVIGEALWGAGDCGVQFTETVASWATCPSDGTITTASAEGAYLFLDDTGCGLAFVNLPEFVMKNGRCDGEGLAHAVRLMTVGLDIAVQMTAWPFPAVAARGWRYRPLGLSPANAAHALIAAGYPYASAEGRSLTAAICALITGVAYAVSGEMAAELGAFPAFADNRDAMMRVIRNHRRAARGARGGYDGVAWPPVALDPPGGPDLELSVLADAAWDRALALGTAHGYRNAQVTLAAPLHRLAAVLDCPPHPFDPPAPMVRQRLTASGGFERFLDPVVRTVLARAGMEEAEIAAVERHALGHGGLQDAPAIDALTLRVRGFDEDAIDAVERMLAQGCDLRTAVTPWVVGPKLCAQLGLAREAWEAPGFVLLHAMGFSEDEIAVADRHVAGTGSLDDAPGIDGALRRIFAAASPASPVGAEDAIRMLAAAQTFLSGGIAQMVRLPHTASVEDCRRAVSLAWRLGLKVVMLEREAARLSEPMARPLDPAALVPARRTVDADHHARAPIGERVHRTPLQTQPYAEPSTSTRSGDSTPRRPGGNRGNGPTASAGRSLETGNWPRPAAGLTLVHGAVALDLTEPETGRSGSAPIDRGVCPRCHRPGDGTAGARGCDRCTRT